MMRPIKFPTLRGSNSERGFTLVELMIAMTIGLILLMGIGKVLIGSSGILKSTDESARMQETAAFAFNTLGNDIRLAGFYGQITNTTEITQPSSITITNDCATGWATKTSEPIFGYRGLSATQANTTLACINTNNFISSSTNRPSFILVLRSASGIQVATTNLSSSTMKNAVYIQSDPNRGIIFKGLQYASLTNSQKITKWDGTDAPVFAYQAKAYYLRPCSRPTGSNNTCTSTDDNGNPIPTLVRQELVNTTIKEVEVVEGVEAMRVTYGIDTSTPSDGIPDIMTETPTAAQFPTVVSIRIALLVRAPSPAENGYDDSSKTYTLDANGSTTMTCDASDSRPCNYRRKVFSQSFQVRNIAQRLETQKTLGLGG